MNMPRANEEDGDLDKLAHRLDLLIIVVRKASGASMIWRASSEQLLGRDGVARSGSEGIRVAMLHGRRRHSRYHLNLTWSPCGRCERRGVGETQAGCDRCDHE